MGALELFSLGYYFRDDKKKVNIVAIILMIIGFSIGKKNEDEQ